MLTDPYQRYAEYFGISRADAKARLFQFTYGMHKFDVEGYVDNLIKEKDDAGSTQS